MNTTEATPPTSPGEAFRVQLPSFDGPLDLLLHLLKEHRIDVLDIPVALITLKYLEHLEAMREINLDIAGEFLVMAATLIHLKSRMVLPPERQAEGMESLFPQEEEDPRAELVRRLLEYQKYRDAASRLTVRGVLGRDVFVRPVLVEEIRPDDPSIPLKEFSIIELVAALDQVLEERAPGPQHQVSPERFSLVQTMRSLATRIRASSGQMNFTDLFDGEQTRAVIIGTFLALLELCKMRAIRISQEQELEDIFVRENGAALDVFLTPESSDALKELDREYQ